MKAYVLLPMLASLAAGQRLVEGNPNSPVRVLIFEDLQCPDCAVLRRMLDEKLLPNYGGKVGFEHRDFPLAKHAWARKAAIASRFFEHSGAELALKWQRHILTTRRETTLENFNERLAAFARANGADPQKAVAALEDARLAEAVERDFQDGVARGVSKTPTMFVSGKPYVETFTYEEVAKGLDAALAEVK